MEPILLQPPVDLPPDNGPIPLQVAQPTAAASVVESPVLPEVQSVSPAPEVPAEPIELFSARSTPETHTNIEQIQAPEVGTPTPRGFFGGLWYFISCVTAWLFGSFSLIVGLAILASIPVIQFLSLGYLLEAAGRIGRSGRLRDAFLGVWVASRIGGIVLGSVPWGILWYVIDLRRGAAELIDPDSRVTLFYGNLVFALSVLIPVHLLLALSRGGRLRYFFWPNLFWFVRRVRQGGYFREAWSSTTTILRSLRLWHYFWLGLRGWLGAAVWLAVPSTLYAVRLYGGGQNDGLAVLGALLGGILLTVIVLYVPFLQVHFAAENRLRAMFELSIVRERFRRAPIAFFISFLFTLLLALPLYLFKIEVVPRDALWLPALVFIVTIFPVKVMTGWAYGRARRRPTRAHMFFRIVGRTLMFPVAAFYAFFVFFTQYTGWHGVLGLYEHHAFLLPVPF